MNRDDAWVARWAAERLTRAPVIVEARLEGSHGLVLIRSRLKSLTVATISVNCVDRENVRHALDLVPNAVFVLNVNGDGYVSMEGFAEASGRGVGVGTMGELASVLDKADASGPVGSKARFVLRSLRQHSNVSDVRRVADVVYSVQRKRGNRIIAAMLYEYDLGVDAVRTAIDRYPRAKVMVKANPNGSVSTRASLAARSAGFELIDSWGEFLAYLARG